MNGENSKHLIIKITASLTFPENPSTMISPSGGRGIIHLPPFLRLSISPS